MWLREDWVGDEEGNPDLPTWDYFEPLSRSGPESIKKVVEARGRYTTCVVSR